MKENGRSRREEKGARGRNRACSALKTISQLLL